MAVLFLARLANLTHNKTLAREAAEQLRQHLHYLQDPETGVLFHGYFCQHQNHQSSALWTRGNAWITIGTPLILPEIQALADIPEEILERYRKMVAGLVKFQSPTGLWSTVMDRPHFYQETSGSAGIACGILKSIHQGLLPASYLPAVEKALLGVQEKIAPDGMVDSVSGGTPIMKTIDEYNQLTRYPTLYGQGLTLQLLAEYAYSS